MTTEYLLVDGYNIIHAWEELKSLANTNLDAARLKLQDILCDYQGFKQNEVILVFDGHKSKGNLGSVVPYYNIDVVYTKEGETADQYIEKVTQQVGREYNVKVATSDALEQLIVLGKGATRMSARELKIEVEESKQKLREDYIEGPKKGRNYLIDNLTPEMAELLEKMRLQE